MRAPSVIALLASACVTSRGAEIPPVPGAQVAGTFLHLTAAGVSAASDASLAHAVKSACNGVCDRVYLVMDVSTAPDALTRLSAAASTASPTPRLFVVAPDDTRIELTADPTATCATEVGVLSTGAYVMRDGLPLPSDPSCSQWDTAICRARDQRYDWPRLRSVLGDQQVVCLAFDTATVAELPAINEALRRPIFRVVAPRTHVESADATEVAEVIRKAGPDLQWCLDGEVAEELVPMQATLRLGIAPDGQVVRAEVLDGVRTTAQFEDCLSNTARTRLTFAPRTTAAIAEVTLAFEPGAKRPAIVVR